MSPSQSIAPTDATTDPRAHLQRIPHGAVARNAATGVVPAASIRPADVIRPDPAASGMRTKGKLTVLA